MIEIHTSTRTEYGGFSAALYWKNNDELTCGIARMTSSLLGFELAGWIAFALFSFKAAWRFPMVRFTAANLRVFFATPMASRSLFSTLGWVEESKVDGFCGGWLLLLEQEYNFFWWRC